MPGLLDKVRKSGGGFMNNVDGVVSANVFTTELPGGGVQTGDFTKLFYRISVQQDGSEKVDETSLDAGNADDFVISEDGMTLTPKEDGAKLWGDTPFVRLYASMVTNAGDSGFEDVDPGDGTISIAHVPGTRVRLVQVKDQSRMDQNIKWFKKDRKKASLKVNELGQRKGKDGKYYDERSLEVAQVYSIGNSVGGVKPAASTSAPKKPVNTTKPLGAKKVATISDTDLREKTKEIVVQVVEAAKDKKMAKTGLSIAVTRRFQQDDLKDNIQLRDDVRKLANQDELLEEMAAEGLIEYAKGTREQTISLT